MRRCCVVLAACLMAWLGPPGLTIATAQPPGSTVNYQTIPGDGGTPLGAFVIEPTGQGDGPFPVLVMPASWALPGLQYIGGARRLAENFGYIIVSYTARGCWDSGGEVEVAGATDIADASRVIDWALANTNADPSKVGMAGISYGSAIGTMTAAVDKRVRAVVAMDTWSSLERSLYPNETVNKQGIDFFLALVHLFGCRAGPALTELEKAYQEDDIQRVIPLTVERSPATKLSGINANNPAVMIANTWGDSFFPPSQVVDFYSALTVPKRLFLFPGDHATITEPGGLGFRNEHWDSAARWFDRHLKGINNGVDAEPRVSLKPNSGGDWRGYPTWQAATTATDTLFLGPEGETSLGSPIGALGDQPATGWSQQVNGGVDTVANSGTVLISGTLQGYLNVPVNASIQQIDRAAAGVWAAAPLATPMTVSGAPRWRTTVTPNAANLTLFAYLFDVDNDGNGSLITHKPYTLRGVTPGTAHTIDFELEPTVWDVRAGHRLVLVVDTVDPRYRSTTQQGTTLTFTSPTNDPSWLRIPHG
ncbi:hypothetical protein GCM10012275_50040 [Longimycelium tulufanense]|uniref:Xaa-Pro dipeptidyl-peptidase C-terminal domain-containing protein n=1 Tax=Longimycelium tulufanense TaxID=907463 RepID=A0A8J3CJV1_9PSEU|nr:CocE/NonD family hydrolase [Longimycelium tulufanense]GGM73392.1 hypothetical protein GCM10012275_50040 [Longimycelium tulufanense]